MSVKSVWHAGFSVRDVEASIAFWTEALGLVLRHRQIQENEYTSFLVGLPGRALVGRPADVARGRLRRLRSHHRAHRVPATGRGRARTGERRGSGAAISPSRSTTSTPRANAASGWGRSSCRTPSTSRPGSIAADGRSTPARPMASPSSSSSPQPCLARRRRRGSEHEERGDQARHRRRGRLPAGEPGGGPIDRQPRDRADRRRPRRRGHRAGRDEPDDRHGPLGRRHRERAVAGLAPAGGGGELRRDAHRDARGPGQGVALDDLEVEVDSESDDRGILGIDDSVRAGPLSGRVVVRIARPACRTRRSARSRRGASRIARSSDAVENGVPLDEGDHRRRVSPTVGPRADPARRSRRWRRASSRSRPSPAASPTTTSSSGWLGRDDRVRRARAGPGHAPAGHRPRGRGRGHPRRRQRSGSGPRSSPTSPSTGSS